MTANDRIVEDYLARLDAALAPVPAARRDEIRREIAAHIAEGRAELPPDDEAGLRTLLDRLGDPAEIADDARDPHAQAGARGRQETIAIVLLLVGGFAWGIGWVVGVVLLWLSDVWNTRDKLIGTLLVPGGLALPLFLLVVVGFSTGTHTSCTGFGTADGTSSFNPPMNCTHSGGLPLYAQVVLGTLLVVLAVAPIWATVYLAQRARPEARRP